MKEYIEDLAEFLDRYKVSESKKNYVCNCPFCLKYGEPNMKPKLWIYKNTNTGYCFRCKTRVTSNLPLNIDLSEDLSETINLESEIIEPEYNIVNLEGLYSYQFESNLVNYINTKRTVSYHDLLKYKNVMSYKYVGKDSQVIPGLFFPFYYNGNCIYYQIRFTEEYHLRYLTKHGDKIPYKLIDSEDEEYITICEGVFDVLGAYALGLPAPVAVLGKTVSNSVLWFLLQYKNLKGIYFALDEIKDNFTLVRELRKYFPTVKMNIVKFSNKDADETFCKGGWITNIIEYNEDMYRLERSINE